MFIVLFLFLNSLLSILHSTLHPNDYAQAVAIIHLILAPLNNVPLKEG